MSLSLRDLIKNANDRPMEGVRVEEWGADLYFRGMTFAEAISYEAQIANYPNGLSAALYLAYTLCDADGNRIYTGTPEDVAEISERCPVVLSRLFHQALEFNGDDGKSKEISEGNSDPNPS